MPAITECLCSNNQEPQPIRTYTVRETYLNIKASKLQHGSLQWESGEI